MIEEALGAGLQLVGSWLECGRGLLRRVGAEVVEPLIRLASAPLAPTPPALEQAPEPEQAGPQERVEEAKYYLGSAPDQAPGRYVDREAGELPRAHGHDHIVVLPRDPWWIFAYWEVTPTTRVQALRALGAEAEGTREVLRVYDVTFITFTGDNAWRSFDVEFTPGADHWYLNVGRPAASFCVEVGLRTLAGRFLPFARSNVVTTPRSSPSPEGAVRWVDVGSGTPRETTARWSGQRLPPGDGAGGASERVTDTGARSSDVHTPPTR